MSDTKFTPGPWIVEDVGISSADGYADILHACDGHVYSEYTSDPATLEISNPANANLIAAAPELYEALDGARQSLEWWLANEPDSFGNIERARLESAIATLKKARGDD